LLLGAQRAGDIDRRRRGWAPNGNGAAAADVGSVTFTVGIAG